MGNLRHRNMKVITPQKFNSCAVTYKMPFNCYQNSLMKDFVHTCLSSEGWDLHITLASVHAVCTMENPLSVMFSKIH